MDDKGFQEVSQRRASTGGVAKKESPSRRLSHGGPAGSPRSSNGRATMGSLTAKNTPPRLAKDSPGSSNGKGRGLTIANPENASPNGRGKATDSPAGSSASPGIGNFKGATLFKDSPGSISGRRLSLGKDSNVNGRSPSSSIPSPVDKIITRRRSMTTAGRDGRAIAGPDWRGQDESRLDLRAQMIRSLDSDLVYLTAKLEFVYLRDNKLSSLEGIEVLKKVKVLDVSFNELKTASLAPLGNCKALQQLYLSGNHLTTLQSLPKLPNLEFLSVAQNEIPTLEFTGQPSLQVLAASKNNIATLQGFPVLPSLESLRLEDNPILTKPRVEAAAIIMAGPSLVKYNNRDVLQSEVMLAQQYPGHTAMCIREGWDLSPPEEAEESMVQFLQGLWAPLLPPNYVLKTAHLSCPQEEEPCHSELVLASQSGTTADSPTLKYQWSRSTKGTTSFNPIEGATKKDYWPRYADVGCLLRMDCTAVVNGKEYGPLALISSPVARGSGLPRIVSIKIIGEPVEGSILEGSADVAWCSGSPGKSITQAVDQLLAEQIHGNRVRGFMGWWRCREKTEPVLIEDAEGAEYEVKLEDVGAVLEFTHIPVTSDGTRGESQTTSTDIVQAANPTVRKMQLSGEPVVGHVLTGSGEFYGGREGKSRLEWFRENPASGQLKPIGSGSFTYTLQLVDVGSRIAFHYTPVTNEGVVGETASIISSMVLHAPPKVADVVVDGELVEGGTLRVSGKYHGGEEGPSTVHWFKSRSPNILNVAELDALPAREYSKELVVPLEAVGFHVVAKYTPVRSDGETGKPLVVVTPGTVQMLPPVITSMSMSGDMVEGGTVVAGYVYFGGYEGKSQYGWYRHKDAKDAGTPIRDGQHVLKYTLRLEDVGHIISFRCLPVRSDGAQGEIKSVTGDSRVKAGLPRVTSLRIVGEPTEGSTLRAVKEYRGGIEGGTILQWHVTRLDGTKEAIRGAVGPEYVVRPSDLDGLLSLSCVPVRHDEVQGPVVVSPLVGPVTASSPRCVGLRIVGNTVEGEMLEAEAVYCGGEVGACTQKWYRRTPDGLNVLITERVSMVLCAEDVGCRILLEFTPVRLDGVAGEAVSILSDVIAPGEPTAVELALPERCEERVPVPLSRRYSGGTEGEGRWAWYRSPTKPELPLQLSSLQRVAHMRSYTPTLEDVDAYLVLEWTPERADGKLGAPKVAASSQPVAPGWPMAKNVTIRQISSGLYEGAAEYSGGHEGRSVCSWFRKHDTGDLVEIPGANSFTYAAGELDYTCRLVLSFTPGRKDGVVGTRVFSQPSVIVLPELPSRHGLTIIGTPAEGETLLAAEIVDEPWEKYKKEVTFQWSRSYDKNGEYEVLPTQRDSKYQVTLGDVGCYLRCTCLLSDIYGRTAPKVESTTGVIAPGKPQVESLSMEGRGTHTSLFTVRATYVGGQEGNSRIQWFRKLPEEDQQLVPVAGEVGRTYEASADDVGCMLVAEYTPVRDDGVMGEPVMASTPVVVIDPDVAVDVQKILDVGSAKFETQQQGGSAALERRVIDVNKKRVKVVRPGTRTSFSSTEVKGTYDPPFRVELTRNDPYHVRIVLGKDSVVELVLHSRHARDVIALAIRQLAQQYLAATSTK